MNKDLMQMTVGAVEKELRKHGSQFLNYRRINHGVLKDVKGSVKVGKVSSVKGAFSELNAKGALNYRGVIGAFNKRASLNDIYGQINITVKQFRKLTQDILGDHDKNLQVARVLMRNGWVTSEFIYNDILKMNYNKSEKEILSYIKKFYSKNNYRRL